MPKEFLVLFLKVLFISEGICLYSALRSLRDSLHELGDADAKYRETIYKYNNFKSQNDLNNGDLLIIIPIEKHNFDKQIARVNGDVQSKIDEENSNIVRREHKARMREIIYFMRDHMMTTKYLHEEVRRIKNTRQVKDVLREMVTYLENPKRHSVKQMFIKIYTFLKKYIKTEEPNIWDQKMNDMVINVIKDPFNDGVIN